jgi:hypothetical protein
VAGFGLVKTPAGCVLGVVVAGTRRADVVFAGVAVGPGLGVVGFAVDGAGSAAGGGAGVRPGVDQVTQSAGWFVLVFAVLVVAGAFGDGLECDLQVAE